MTMKISVKMALAISASCLVFAPPAWAQDKSAATTANVMDAKVSPVTPKDVPQLGTYGFDDTGMDTAVKPGDDFYNYANAKWEKKTEIPADKSNYGMFSALYDLSKERVGKILDTAKKQKGSKIGDAYASYLDTASVEKLGMAPIKPWMQKIRAVKTHAQLEKLLPQAARNGVSGFFGGYVGQDDKNPENYIFQISQGGTGLRDRDMYLVKSDKLEANRTAYRAYLAKMLSLAGEANSAARADAIFEMEKEIATIHWTREDSSDATKTYNKMTVAQLTKAAPGMNIAVLLKSVSPKIDSIIVSQPSAITGTAKIFAETSLQVLKDKMLVNSLASYADVLPDAVSNTSFAFYGTVMSGTPQREIRWKRGVSFAEGALGEEVGKAYAAQYFPPETKAAMDVLVKNVLTAMGRRIESLEWMQPATKAKAKTKLANFTTKIGYPDKWRDYSGLKIGRGDLFGNALRSNQFDYDDGIAKLGMPLRRWEWGMLPQTVNAYANFGMNEIVFPAAILQPPFFDPNADAAINYGGIGAVIGHEVSHHFDDQGAKYDETGKLADWWTPTDVAAFEKAGKALIAQYDAYEIFPGQFVKGEFTLGENIGDLAGLTVAYDAYKTSLNGKEAPVIGGMTGDQRFFLGWAQVWRRKVREAEARQRLLTDPHSPSPQRVSVVRNLDKWYDAFNPTPQDKLYLKKENRVRIW